MSVMYVATLDILTEKGGFNPQAARAIGEAIDLEIARSRAATATREDLSEFRRALSEEIGARGVETEKNISALRTELSGVRAELKDDINKLRTEQKGDKADLVRWVFVVIMGQSAMLLGILYFFIRYFK
jgi:seryl-tRNA synthetase